MKVIITGGGGFLGSQLCQKLLERGTLTGPSGGAEKIREIVLLDALFHRPSIDPCVRQVTGDISNRDAVFSAGPITDAFDARIQGIVDNWPVAVDGARAIALGLPQPPPLKQIVEQYIGDFGKR